MYKQEVQRRYWQFALKNKIDKKYKLDDNYKEKLTYVKGNGIYYYTFYSKRKIRFSQLMDKFPGIIFAIPIYKRLLNESVFNQCDYRQDWDKHIKDKKYVKNKKYRLKL